MGKVCEIPMKLKENDEKDSVTSIHLQSCQNQQNSEVDLDDHIEVFISKALGHLADEEQHPCGQEHGQDAANQRSAKDNFHDNPRLALDREGAENYIPDKV